MKREYQRLEDENARLRRELRARYDLSAIVGRSAGARRLREAAGEVASLDTAALICGELGAGKELVARAIHYNSSRAGKPFVKVPCATLPDNLLEWELFGPSDAVTGAGGKTRVDLAAGGTLFLDEIDRLNERTQARLLRVLLKTGAERLGGQAAGRACARVVAATGSDLAAAVAAGSFRDDLYRELASFVVFVPALRDRREDILPLANHFLERHARDHEAVVTRLSTAATAAIMNYGWPGNVGELEDALDRAVLACESQVIYVHHLPSALHQAESSHGSSGVPLAAALDAYERELIQDALKTARGNRAKAARLLGTTERIVNYKIKKLEIDYRRFRPAGSRHVRLERARVNPAALRSDIAADGLL